MDSVPFMLFFFVCLPNSRALRDDPSITWTENCAPFNYCWEKPDNYPSQRLEELFARVNVTPIHDTGLHAVNQSTQDTEHRPGVTNLQNLCKYNEQFEQLYMIIDWQDRPRYVVQIPGIFEMRITLRTCLDRQQQEKLDDRIECRQKYSELPLLVLSHDRTNLEVESVLPTKGRGLPTNCAPVFKIRGH